MIKPIIITKTGHVHFQGHLALIKEYLMQEKLGHLIDPLTKDNIPEDPGRAPTPLTDDEKKNPSKVQIFMALNNLHSKQAASFRTYRQELNSAFCIIK